MLTLIILASITSTVYMISNTDQSDVHEMLRSEDWFN